MTHASLPNLAPAASAAAKPMRDRLAAIMGKQSRMRRFARCVSVIAAWSFIALCCLLIDAASPLPDWLRLAVSAVLLVSLIVSLIIFASRDELLSKRSNDFVTQARLTEQRMGARGNPLVNAVGLTGVDHPLAHALANRAAIIGQHTLDEATTDWTALERVAVKDAGSYLWLAVIAWFAIAIIFSSLLPCELSRFTMPFADHPPFSLTHLDVRAAPLHPLPGQDSVVTVRITGQPVDRASLVTLDAAGHVQGRWRMQPSGAKGTEQFTRTLVGVRQPIHLRIEAGGARSQMFTVSPRLPAKQTRSESNSNKPPHNQTQHPHPRPRPTNGHSHTSQHIAATGSQNLGQLLTALQKQAQAIAKMAQAAGKNPARQKALAAAIKRFRNMAAKVKNANGAPTAIRSAIAGRMAILNLMRIHFPGENKPPNKGGAKGKTPADWSGAVARGAGADAKAIAGMMTVIGANENSQHKPTVSLHTSGTYHEQTEAQKRAAAVQALVDQAPPVYRSQVRAYFDRLAQGVNQEPAGKEKP